MREMAIVKETLIANNGINRRSACALFENEKGKCQIRKGNYNSAKICESDEFDL